MTESSADIRAQKKGKGPLGGSSRKAIAQMGNLSGGRGRIRRESGRYLRLGAMHDGVGLPWKRQLP